MANFHIQMTAGKQYSLAELESKLRFNSNFDFCSRVEHRFDGADLLLLTFEQLFYRAHGTISLSVLLTESCNLQTADLIASGGGDGWSWSGGACRSFAKEAAVILTSCGFSDLNPEPEDKLHQKIFNYFFD